MGMIIVTLLWFFGLASTAMTMPQLQQNILMKPTEGVDDFLLQDNLNLFDDHKEEAAEFMDDISSGFSPDELSRASFLLPNHDELPSQRPKIQATLELVDEGYSGNTFAYPSVPAFSPSTPLTSNFQIQQTLQTPQSTTPKPLSHVVLERFGDVNNLPYDIHETSKMWCSNPPYIHCAVCVPNPPASDRHAVIGQGLLRFRHRPRIPRGLILFDVGETVYYRPKSAGWSLRGDLSVTCQANGTWTKPPTCQRPYCKGLPTLENGVCTGSDRRGVRLMGRATCSCNYGYTLQGFPHVTCLNLGHSQWGTRPKCISNVTNSCPSAPRILRGTCSLFTNRPPSTEHMKHANFARCRCGPGYGFRTSHRSQTSEAWSVAKTWQIRCVGNNKFEFVPQCEPVPMPEKKCEYPPEVLNAGCDKCDNYPTSNMHIRFKPGHSIRYQCKQGYVMQGNPVIYCLQNGQWTRKPVCVLNDIPKTCSLLPVVENGFCQAEFTKSYASDGIPAGNEVTCVCNEGFEMQGKSVIFCLRGGEWTSAPKCSQIVTKSVTVCHLDDINEAIANATCGSSYFDGAAVFASGEQVLCDCDMGYRLEGSPIVTCGGNTGWSSNRPRCRPVKSCGDIPEIMHGFCWSTDFDDGFLEGEELECGCDAGYTLLDKDRKIRCESNGSWSTVPICFETNDTGSDRSFECPAIDIPNGRCGNGELGFSVGEMIICTCTANGNTSEAICRSRGRGWTELSMNCPPVVEEVITSDYFHYESYEDIPLHRSENIATETLENPASDVICDYGDDKAAEEACKYADTLLSTVIATDVDATLALSTLLLGH